MSLFLQNDCHIKKITQILRNHADIVYVLTLHSLLRQFYDAAERPVPHFPDPAEKTTPRKADTNQKDHRGKTKLSDLPENGRYQVENPSIKSAAQKMDPPQEQSSVQQVEKHNTLSSNNTSSQDMKPDAQVLLGNGTQPTITEQSPVSAAFAKIAGNADSGSDVREQIQESIHSSLRSGNQQIVIRLNPPELGKVAIKFQEQADGITGLLEVDKPQTKYEIQQTLTEIIRNLQDSGIQIKKLEVVLTNQQEQNALKDQSSTTGQNSWLGQQSSPNSGSRENNTAYNEWPTDIDNVAEFMEPQMQFADNSINMLV